MSDIVRAHVFVSGRVQGVFFRTSALERASAFSVSGWIRNCADGRVEAIFQGPKSEVELMVQWCYEGPQWASVAAVDVAWEDPKPETEFRVR